MKTSNKNNERRIVKFHISGGGGNNRKLTFVGEEKIGEGAAFNSLHFDEESGSYLSSNGNLLHDDLTQEDVDSGIGTINEDHYYDTTFTTYLDDLSENGMIAIAKSNEWNKVELLEAAGIENAPILDLFNLLDDAVRNGEVELEDHFIEEISEKEYDEQEDDDFDYRSISGRFFKMEE